MLVHISTDYVFYGDTGNYLEDDPVGPVHNYYALSKLVAEEVARLAERPPDHPHQLSPTRVSVSGGVRGRVYEPRLRGRYRARNRFSGCST